MTTSFLLERAWVGGAVRDDVLVEIVDGRFSRVEPGGRVGHPAADASPFRRRSPRSGGEADTLPGLTLPGLANTHSHAFHRALRGRTQRERGTFWTWREQMYAVAERLDPDSYHRLATAVFREMVAAGMTSVGEFHYLHHQPDGTPYDDPNAMSHALVASAREAGIRLTLLDTCYLSSGFGEPPAGVQRRFSDGDADRWRERVERLSDGDDLKHGAAIHSVRAVPPEAMPTVVDGARGRPLHAHVSEQVAENAACVAAYARTPVELLADHDVLGPLTTAVHATHLTDDDVRLLAEAQAYAGFCPTTERDLGDGIGPGRRLHEAGVRLTLGSDSHAVVDPFEELRALELDERLARQQRGHWTAGELLTAATTDGHRSLGWDDAGEIAVGRRADLVTLDTASPRTAGTGADEHTAVFAATAADVTHVVVEGRVVATADDRDDLGRDLDDAIRSVHA
ncbi:formimidoylglutamate deiminase [Nocardioides euryhalodurans]|uniref:Formimidoylglutamate deiminase n=1 Tax=Nocardioides euryhalodurans TaxID=2518370 RepID=A0A4P7GN15_9ACTN|nr:formimidoylglutamate deiminase [Nocardioides euryhalodurans]QBR93181.1 formimidoylglutamate deiminase [Nocardioides euryhalodurans]